MAYIQPNSDVYILKGCENDSLYHNTYIFKSLAEQASFFISKQKYRFTELTYQRANKNSIRVEKLCDDLYDCNYMMFRNTAYGNKWFYAFIDRVDYINDNTTEITYSLDAFQSWMFDFEFEKCFIDREHCRYDSDTLYGNIVDESITNTDPIFDEIPLSVDLSEIVVVLGIAAGYDMQFHHLLLDNSFQIGNAYARTFSGVHYYAFDLSVALQYESIPGVFARFSFMDALIQNLALEGKEDLLKSAFCFPKNLLSYTEDTMEVSYDRFGGKANHKVYIIDGVYETQNVGSTGTRTHTELININTQTIDGYTPKNKKCFIYPFNYLVIYNDLGEKRELALERFNYNVPYPSRPSFKIESAICDSPSIRITPRYYNNLISDYTNSLEITDYPPSNFIYEIFTNWFAQHSVSLALGSISSILTGGNRGVARLYGSKTHSETVQNKDVMMYNDTAISSKRNRQFSNKNVDTQKDPFVTESYMPITGTLGIVTGILNDIGNLTDHMQKPNDIIGKSGGGLTSIGSETKKFFIYQAHLRNAEVRRLDDYFTMYGYKESKLDVPVVANANLRRPVFNYLRCVLPQIHPAAGKGLPQDAEDAILSMLERGITFWYPNATHFTHIGDYSVDNITPDS